nr:hypothetical protein BHI3_17530 [Bacteriovorax sp. HI3]
MKVLINIALSLHFISGLMAADMEPAVAGPGFSWNISDGGNLKCYKVDYMGARQGAYKEGDPKCAPPKLVYKWAVKKDGAVECQAGFTSMGIPVSSIYGKTIPTNDKCDKKLLPKIVEKVPEKEEVTTSASWLVGNKNLKCYKTDYLGGPTSSYKEGDPNCIAPRLVYKWEVDAKSGAVKCEAYFSSHHVVSIYNKPIKTESKCNFSLLPKEDVNFQLSNVKDNSSNTRRSPKIIEADGPSEKQPAHTDSLSK